MPEPASPVALAAWVSGVSAAILALLGVDYYSLVGAFLGVLFTVSTLKASGRLELLAAVVLSTLVSAVLGQAIAEYASIEKRAGIMSVALVVGAGCQAVVQALLAALVARIQKLGGQA